MNRQTTVNSSQDSQYVLHYAQIKNKILEAIDLTRKQRVVRSTFKSVRDILKKFDTLLEGSDVVKGMFRKGKEVNLDLSEAEKRRVDMIVEIEANLHLLVNICNSLKYYTIEDEKDRERMAMKYVAIVDITKQFSSLMTVRSRMKNAFDSIIADADTAEEAENVLASFRMGTEEEEEDLFAMESEDSLGMKEKLENLFNLMISDRFLRNESTKALDKMSSSGFGFETISEFKQLFKENKIFRTLRLNCLIHVYKKKSHESKLKVIEVSSDDFEESLISYEELNLYKLHKLEFHKEMSYRFNKAFLLYYFGSYYDSPQRGFQLCYRPSNNESYLRDYIYGEEYHLEKTYKFIVQMIEAIRFAHDQLITIGEFRPETVFLRKGHGNPHLVVLSLLDDIKPKQQASEEDFLEKARYQAPEHLHGHDDLYVERNTFSSDIYSFGCLVWEMLQKQKPYDSVDNLQDLVDLKIKGEGPSTLLDPEEDKIENFEYVKLLRTLFSNVLNINPFKRTPSSKLTRKKGPLKKILKRVL